MSSLLQAKETQAALRGGFYLSVEIGNDLLECRDSLLDRSYLHQFPVTDRAIAILQRDDQVTALLLELNKRQTVIWQISGHGGPAPGLNEY
jgi:hypothetical protein